MKKIRVLVADDHPVFGEGLCRLLNHEKDLYCIGVAADGLEAVKLAKELHPDVALVDVSMPKMNGIEAAKQIKRICPTTVVLMLSAYKYQHYVRACIEARADGYLLKTTPRRELIYAIRMAYGGQGVFNLEATSNVLHGLASLKDKQRAGLCRLHSRELQVLKLAARGMGNKQIASELGITSNTVGSHFVNIFRKLRVESRTEAVLYALNEGFITMDDVALEAEH